MVQYLASSASRSITVIPLEIGTTLSIVAPDQITQGDTFTIQGQLTRNDTGAAISGATISVGYDGSSLGSVVTDMVGVYTIPAAIPNVGTFTLTANFAGMTVPGLTLGASYASKGIGLVEPGLVSPLVVLVAVALGVGLLVVSKK